MPEWQRRWAVFIGALSLSVQVSIGAQAGGDDGDALVDLDLINGDSQTLRCVTVLAHFVSLPDLTIAPGATLRVSYFRGADDGTLYILLDDGRQMMVENLLCGRTDDWDATRGEVPLLDVRASASPHMVMTCQVADRLQCAL